MQRDNNDDTLHFAPVHRLQASLKSLEQQNAQLRSSIADLKRKLFATKELPDQLALDLGFNSLDSLSEHVKKDAHIWNRAAIEWNADHMPLLEAELRKQNELRRAETAHHSPAEDQVHGLNDDLESVNVDAIALKEKLEEVCVATASEIAQLKDELRHRNDCYAGLKAMRDRLQGSLARERDLRTRFALHIEGMANLDGEDLVHAAKRLIRHWAKRKPSGDDLNVKTEEVAAESVLKMPAGPETPHKQRSALTMTSPLAQSKDNFQLSSSTQMRPTTSTDRATPLASAPITPRKRKRSNENEAMPPPPTLEESQTQDDSQMPTQFAPGALIRFTPKKRARLGKPASAPSISWHSPVASSPTDFSPTKRNSPSSPNPQKVSTTAINSTKKQVADSNKTVSKVKRRGRYSEPGLSNAPEDGEESDYELNPDANSGLNYKFANVVRNKRKRAALQAEDCEECRDYYEAVGPMPPRLHPPLWRSPTSSPGKNVHQQHHHRHRGQVETTRALDDEHLDLDGFADHQRQRAVAAHKHEVSRHRNEWETSRTPPGYWDIGFPDTQKVTDINARADEMRREKEAGMRDEARKDGGRYRKKKAGS